MPKWNQYFKDEGWLQEGHILFFETQNLNIAKTVAGERVGQHLTLPTEGILPTPGHKIILKFRSHSRCMYCYANVLEVNDDEMNVRLPQQYESLNRAYFHRIDLYRPAKMNGQDVQVIDISIAGAAIRTLEELEVGRRYPFQLGMFVSRVLVREVKDSWVRVQFALRDNLNVNLANIVRNAIQARPRHRRAVSV